MLHHMSMETETGNQILLQVVDFNNLLSVWRY